jgi:hypothetical protein
LLIAVEQVAYYLSHKEKAPQGRSTGSMSPKDTAASLATYGIGYFAAPLGRFIDVPFLAIAAWLTPFALPCRRRTELDETLVPKTPAGCDIHRSDWAPIGDSVPLLPPWEWCLREMENSRLNRE